VISREGGYIGSGEAMIVSIADLISYVGQFMRFLPGDVILTGTPSGVGLGQQPPVYLPAVA
jgi:2,4-diketo-3-deoxy-L-fuconate hydrolase